MQKLLTDLTPSATASETDLGQRVRDIRKARGWKLQDLADRTGLAVSTISKMERGEISLTYDRFMRLAQGLGMDVGELFDANAEGFTQGSVSVTRAREGTLHRSETYDYEMIAGDLAGKHMVPMIGHIRANSFAAFEDYISHPGEEFVHVITGRVTVHIKGRAPVTLDPGDSIYFDSALGHVYVSAGDEDATVVAACWKPG